MYAGIFSENGPMKSGQDRFKVRVFLIKLCEAGKHLGEASYGVNKNYFTVHCIHYALATMIYRTKREFHRLFGSPQKSSKYSFEAHQNQAYCPEREH